MNKANVCVLLPGPSNLRHARTRTDPQVTQRAAAAGTDEARLEAVGPCVRRGAARRGAHLGEAVAEDQHVCWFEVLLLISLFL